MRADQRAASSTIPSRSADHLLRLLVIDLETTGLDVNSHELIGLAAMLVEVQKPTGCLIRVLKRYDGLQEPAQELSPWAAGIVGYDHSALVGQRFDLQRINEMVQACDLVVAHNAYFDRAFVERVIPAFHSRPWVCSLHDIDWWGLQAQEAASVEKLALRLGHDMNSFMPMPTVEAMVHLLASPLPVTKETGFGALIAASKGPFIKFVIPDPEQKLEIVMLEYSIEYSEQDRAWSTVLWHEEALAFQDTLVDLAVFDRRVRAFQVQEMDPLLRFSNAIGGY